MRDRVPAGTERRRRVPPALAAIVALAVTAAGCGSRAATDSPPPTDGLREIQVELTDGLRIKPDLFEVTAGETVRFVVTNAGGIDHELYIGDEIAQQAHADEMRATGGRLQDSDRGVGLKPKTRNSLMFTFTEAGSLIAGCHLPGHFQAGMRATIAISP